MLADTKAKATTGHFPQTIEAKFAIVAPSCPAHPARFPRNRLYIHPTQQFEFSYPAAGKAQARKLFITVAQYGKMKALARPPLSTDGLIPRKAHRNTGFSVRLLAYDIESLRRNHRFQIPNERMRYGMQCRRI